MESRHYLPSNSAEVLLKVRKNVDFWENICCCRAPVLKALRSKRDSRQSYFLGVYRFLLLPKKICSSGSMNKRRVSCFGSSGNVIFTVSFRGFRGALSWTVLWQSFTCSSLKAQFTYHNIRLIDLCMQLTHQGEGSNALTIDKQSRWNHTGDWYKWRRF